MNARKEKVDGVAADIKREEIKSPRDNRLIVILGEQMEGYLENWLNSADRLAYCIKNNYVPERDWRAEYRTYFHELIRNHQGKFGPGSIYNNLIDLDNKWQRE